MQNAYLSLGLAPCLLNFAQFLFKIIQTEDDFVDLYYLKKDININDIKIQKEEVETVKWASRKEIQNMINQGIFNQSHEKFYHYCLEFLDK